VGIVEKKAAAMRRISLVLALVVAAAIAVMTLTATPAVAQEATAGGTSAKAGAAAAAPPEAAPAPPRLSAGLAITGADYYIDTATESRKDVKFEVIWEGGVKEDYIIVNWGKGYMKDPTGTPYKVQQFGTLVDFDSSNWQVDSLDADPAYWSSDGVRWGYNVEGPNKFSATDQPSPFQTKDGIGAKARVDFKTAVYKSSDVPMTTNADGTIDATPLTPFQYWEYYVEVLGEGKFNHEL
jgi:hypothetical protein